MSTPPSRRLSAQRRSTACASRIRASASTPIATPPIRMNPSHARRSPGIGSGTSVPIGTVPGTRRRNRSSSASWPASSAGSPPGTALTISRSPTAAHARPAWSKVSSSSFARSILPNCACDIPTRCPAARWLSPDDTRAFLISCASSPSARRISTRVSTSRLLRLATGQGWPLALSCGLPGWNAQRAVRPTGPGRYLVLGRSAVSSVARRSNRRRRAWKGAPARPPTPLLRHTARPAFQGAVWGGSGGCRAKGPRRPRAVCRMGGRGGCRAKGAEAAARVRGKGCERPHDGADRADGRRGLRGPPWAQCSVTPVKVQASMRTAGTTAAPRKPLIALRELLTAVTPARASR